MDTPKAQPSSRQSLTQLIAFLELSELQRHFMRSRWLDQLSYMSHRARQARNWYYTLRLTAIIGSVLVPILLGLQQPLKEESKFDPRWFAIGLSGVVAISTAVEEFFHFGDRWRQYRRTTEALKAQGWQFSQLSGSYHTYPSHQSAFESFANQIEIILQNDLEIYITEVVKEKGKAPSTEEINKTDSLT